MISRLERQIWQCILDEEKTYQEIVGEPSPLPGNTGDVLTVIFGLCSENRPLDLSDQHAFWDHETDEDDSGIALAVIAQAVETMLARPQGIEQRRFLEHCQQCVDYLRHPGF